MKKCYLLLSILLILSILAGCAKTDYSTAPFFKIEGTDFSPTDLRVKLGMAKIPTDQYETYPSMQNAPISATLYQDGERILDGFKAQGRFAAGKEGTIWGVNESADKTPAAASYVEDLIKADMTEFCRNNPQATVQQLNEYLNARITTYNKSTVAQIADMQLKEAVNRQGDRKNRKRTGTLKDGTLGTYNGRKVIYKNGKWEYAE
jgi:PBP1b-binding outer membrane lipoprotein LpoB